MEFQVNKNEFSSILKDAQAFVGNKSTNSKHASLFFKLAMNELTVKAQSTGQVFTADKIAVIGNDMGSEDGYFSVTADLFVKIIDGMCSSKTGSTEYFIISVDKDFVHIKDTKTSSNFKLKATNVLETDFPESIGEATQTVKLPKGVFCTMLQNTINSVSCDESKPILKGILLETENNIVRLVATDGRRLSACAKQIENADFGEKKCAIIPASFLSDLFSRKIINYDTESCFSLHESEIKFEFSKTIGETKIINRHYVVVSNLIKGNFPAYQTILSGFENSKNKCCINLEEFKKALSMLSVAVDSKNKKILTNMGEKEIEFIGEQATNSINANIKIPMTLSGEKVETAFNVSYISSAVKNMNCKEVEVSFADASKPFFFSPDDDRNTIHVIMPMNRAA